MNKDLILFNGNIYTMNFSKTKVEALLIRKGKIIELGTNEEIKSNLNMNYEFIDLKGKVVLPGFIDSHVHFLNYAKSIIGINLNNIESKEAVIDNVKTRVSKSKPEVWILGYGWNENDWRVKTLPSRSDLDKVCDKNPVETVNPIRDLYVSITRQREDGYPNGGWYPEHRLTLEQAIYSYTYEGAYASADEDIKGSIEIGKLADLIVLSDDIFKISPKDILDVKVIHTILDGNIVYSS